MLQKAKDKQRDELLQDIEDLKKEADTTKQ